MLGRLTLDAAAAMPTPGLEQRRTRAADRCKLATIVRHEQGLALDKWRSARSGHNHEAREIPEHLR